MLVPVVGVSGTGEIESLGFSRGGLIDSLVPFSEYEFGFFFRKNMIDIIIRVSKIELRVRLTGLYLAGDRREIQQIDFRIGEHLHDELSFGFLIPVAVGRPEAEHFVVSCPDADIVKPIVYFLQVRSLETEHPESPKLLLFDNIPFFQDPEIHPVDDFLDLFPSIRGVRKFRKLDGFARLVVFRS